ncbi:hypothetical protein [Haladaptatus sp. CMAA 1911]|uniref:hypothetical protein n=1 Tax=unclassified Haladaptatus TaxID=2622732 RepID=UPI00375519BB
MFLEDVLDDLGEADGYEDMAAAKIPMGLYADACNGGSEQELLNTTEDLIERRFFEYAGYDDANIVDGT